MTRPVDTLPQSTTAAVAVHCPPGRDTVRWLLSRNAHHPTAVALNPAACNRLSIRDVAEAALENMGHDMALSRAIRPADALAAAWMRGRKITDALFVDAQIHAIDRVRQVLDWTQGMGIRVWLCITRDEPNDLRVAAVERLAVQRGGHTVSYSTLTRTFRDQPLGEPAADDPVPIVPLVDVMAFRPACRELLPDATFKTVDKMYVDTVLAVRGALADGRDRHRSRGARKTFRAVLEEAGNLDEFVIKTRAIQAAALTSGMNVRVLVPSLIGGEATITRRGKIDALGGWRTLSKYRDPDMGAIAAMYSHGIEPETMLGLTIDDVRIDPNGSATVRTPSGLVRIDGEPALFLRVLVEYRHLTSASASAALLHTHRDDEISVEQLSALLAAPPQETGLDLCPRPLRVNGISDELWLSRHGISVTMIRRRDRQTPHEKEL